MVNQQLQAMYLRIAPDAFHNLKFILEGYDNLAILSSFDRVAGIVIIRYPAEMTRDIFSLLASIAPSLIATS